MPNFVTLCKKAHQLIGAGPGSPGTLPTTVTGQTENLGKIVVCINDGWRLIQGKRSDWLWMRGKDTFDTVAGIAEYNPASTITRYRRPIPRQAERGVRYISCYKISIGATDEQPIEFIEPAEFEGYYDAGFQTQQARPTFYSLRPDNKIIFFPIPDAAYRVILPYQKTRQSLTADADTPEMPDHFHDMIVYQAIRLYGAQSENTRNWKIGGELYEEMFNDLVREQAPRIIG